MRTGRSLERDLLLRPGIVAVITLLMSGMSGQKGMSGMTGQKGRSGMEGKK